MRAAFWECSHFKYGRKNAALFSNEQKLCYTEDVWSE